MDKAGPLISPRRVSVAGMCVSGAAAAAAEPQRLQEAVRATAGAGARARAGVDRSRRRGASQLHLHASRRGGTAAHVQRRAQRRLRRPGADPQDGEPSRLSPAVRSAAGGRSTDGTGAEPAEVVWVRKCQDEMNQRQVLTLPEHWCNVILQNSRE